MRASRRRQHIEARDEKRDRRNVTRHIRERRRQQEQTISNPPIGGTYALHLGELGELVFPYDADQAAIDRALAELLPALDARILTLKEYEG